MRTFLVFTGKTVGVFTSLPWELPINNTFIFYPGYMPSVYDI